MTTNIVSNIAVSKKNFPPSAAGVVTPDPVGLPTRVVNLKKGKCDVFIGRPSIFGNPFYMKDESKRDDVVDKYVEYFMLRVRKDSEFRKEVLKLKGKRLGCFCAPRRCHGDIIAHWLDSQNS